MRKQPLPYGDALMISDGYNIGTFLKTIEDKDLSEIISFADREALAAWRRAYREKMTGKPPGDTPARYEKILEELVSFLRSALPYRPFTVDERLFSQFLQLRRKLFEEKRGPAHSKPSEGLLSDTVSAKAS
jgi:hypothetical protein